MSAPSLPNTLCLGGGVLKIKNSINSTEEIHLGYVRDFEAGADIVTQHRDIYIKDAVGRMIRVPSTSGVIRSVNWTGGFVCESITRHLIQRIWLLCDDSIDGASVINISDLQAVTRSLIWYPDYLLGNTPVIFPAVDLQVTSKFPFNSETWKSLTFSFRALFSRDQDTSPVMKVL